MRLGVFLPNWIGDVVMATPAIRALRKLVGDEGQLVGIMRPYVAEVLEGTTWFDGQILYEKPKRRFSSASGEAIRQLRAARLDSAVLFPNSLRTAWLAWRSGARERIGHVGQARSWLLTRRLSWLPRQATIDAYLTLAAQVGCVAEPPRMELATTAADENAADRIWQRLKLPPADEVVILNSGGAYGAAKHWPVEHFAELARRIVAERELAVLINCGPAEREIARAIEARADNARVVSLASCEQLPIGLTKACIRRSRLLVTTDSGPRFLAVAFNRPVVTLFGPTDPADTKTYYPRETCLSLALDCQPCMERVCPLGHHRCMRELLVENVFAAVTRHLDSGAVQDAA